MNTFDPNSFNARFAEVLSEIRSIKEAAARREVLLEEIKEQVTYTNGKVKTLYVYKEIIVWVVGTLIAVVLAVIARK